MGLARSELIRSWFGFTIKTALNQKTLILTVHGVIFGMAIKISEGHLRLRFCCFFFWWGGGGRIFGRAYFRRWGRGWAYCILRHSLVRTCVKSCQFFLEPALSPKCIHIKTR